MWNPSLYLTNIIRIIYNSHPSRRTAKFWNENVFFKFIDLLFLMRIMESLFHFLDIFFAQILQLNVHWIYFSCKLSKKILQERQTCKYIKNYLSQYESKYKGEIIDIGMKRIFVKYLCYINSPPLFSCDTLGVEHSNLQNKRFHHQINQTIYQ